MTLAQRWSDHVMPTPTFNQQTDTLPTLDQCTDADWGQELPSSLQQTYMFGVHATTFCVFKRNINIRGASILIMHVHVTNLYIINDIKQR